MKKIISLLLSFCMVMSFMTFATATEELPSETLYSIDFEKLATEGTTEIPDGWKTSASVSIKTGETSGTTTKGKLKYDALFADFQGAESYIWYTNMPSNGNYTVSGTYGNYKYGDIEEMYLFFDSSSTTGMASRPMFRLIRDTSNSYTRIMLMDTWKNVAAKEDFTTNKPYADFSSETVGVDFVYGVNNVDFEITYEDGYVSLSLTNRDITDGNTKNTFSTGKIKVDGVLNGYTRTSNFGISGYPSYATVLRNLTVTATYDGWKTNYNENFTTATTLDSNWKLYGTTALHTGTDKTSNPQYVKTGIATESGQFTKAWYTNSAKADNMKISGTYMTYHGDGPTIDLIVNATIYEGELTDKHGEIDNGFRYRLSVSGSATQIDLQYKTSRAEAPITLATYAAADVGYNFIKDVENVNFEINIADNKMSLTLTDASDATKTFTTSTYDISKYQKTENVGFLSDNNYWFALRNLKITSTQNEILLRKADFSVNSVTYTAAINTIDNGSEKNPVIIAAAYDSLDKIIGTSIVSTEKYAPQILLDAKIITEGTASTIKLFLWDGSDYITPLCVNATYSK